VKKLGEIFSPNSPACYPAVFRRISGDPSAGARPVVALRASSKSLILRATARRVSLFYRPNRPTTLRLTRSGFAQRELMMTHTILRLPAVKTSTGLSRSTIYLRVSQGTFPRPVSLGGRAVGWLEAEIQEWLQRRIEASRKAAA
jgi:prophage regulatory protein